MKTTCQEAQKRRYPRVEVTIRVDVTDGSGRSWMELAGDLSQGGMRLAHPIPSMVSDTVTVAFQLPTGRPCKRLARVVCVDAEGCALEFVLPLPAGLLGELREGENGGMTEKRSQRMH